MSRGDHRARRARATSGRRAAVDAPTGRRHGYGKPRRFTLTAGTVTGRRPRVRGLGERFVSRVLPLVTRHPREGGAWLLQRSLQGLKPWRGTMAAGPLGLWAALGEQQPAAEQRCWHHRLTTVLEARPTTHQAHART